MLFFPLMTDGGRAGLVEITFQAFFWKYRRCPAPVVLSTTASILYDFVLSKFFQKYCSSAGANSITTVTTPPHQQSPAFVLLQMVRLFSGQ